MQFIRVCLQIVELIDRTGRGEPGLHKLRGQPLFLLRQHDLLPPGIARAVHGRVALVRRDVVDELVAGAAHAAAVVHAAGGGVQVKGGAAVRSALGEDVLALIREGFALQQRQKAHAADALRHFQASRFEASRRDVLARDQRTGVAARLDDARPPGEQRHIEAGIVQRALAAGEGHAVVAHENHECVVEAGALFDDVEHALKVGVAVFDLAHVAREITANAGQIRQPARDGDFVRIRRRFAAGPGMVRIAEVHPEEEGLVLRAPVKELAHPGRHVFLAGGVHIVKAVCESAHLVLIKDRIRGGGRAAGAVEVVAAPANADEVASLTSENFRERGFIARQRRREARDARRHRRAAGHDGSAGGHALRRGGEHAAELDALRRQAVEVGRLQVGASIAAQERLAVVVRKHEHDVGRRGEGGAGKRQQSDEGGQTGHDETESPPLGTAGCGHLCFGTQYAGKLHWRE